MASQAFNRALYGSHPYAHPDIGYAQSVSIFKLDRLKLFHETHYGPDGLVIAVCGGIEPEMAQISSSRSWEPGNTMLNPLLRSSRPLSLPPPPSEAMWRSKRRIRAI